MMENEKNKWCPGCQNSNMFEREIMALHEEINGRISSVEEDVKKIKDDVTELKTAMTANSSNITNLIKKLDGDKQLQMWALGLVIAMSASFGVFLVQASYNNSIQIEKIKTEHQMLVKDIEKIGNKL